MYITIPGIKRSGSTWLGNAVRIICEEAGLTAWMGEWYSTSLRPGANVTINKLHPYNQQVAERSDYIFTSWRRLGDIRSSWRRFSGENLDHNLQEQWLAWSHLWTFRADYLMPFPAIKEAPDVVVDNIYNILRSKKGVPNIPNVNIRRDVVLERLEKEVVPPTDKQYDPKTCLFSNHITRP